MEPVWKQCRKIRQHKKTRPGTGFFYPKGVFQPLIDINKTSGLVRKLITAVTLFAAGLLNRDIHTSVGYFRVFGASPKLVHQFPM